MYTMKLGNLVRKFSKLLKKIIKIDAKLKTFFKIESEQSFVCPINFAV